MKHHTATALDHPLYTRHLTATSVLGSLQGEYFSKKCQKRVFDTKSIQIGPKSISSKSPWLKIRKDLELRIKNNPNFTVLQGDQGNPVSEIRGRPRQPCIRARVALVAL